MLSMNHRRLLIIVTMIAIAVIATYLLCKLSDGNADDVVSIDDVTSKPAPSSTKNTIIAQPVTTTPFQQANAVPKQCYLRVLSANDRTPVAGARAVTVTNINAPLPLDNHWVDSTTEGTVPYVPGTFVLIAAERFARFLFHPNDFPKDSSVTDVLLHSEGIVRLKFVTIGGAPIVNKRVVACHTWSLSESAPTWVPADAGTIADGYTDTNGDVELRGVRTGAATLAIHDDDHLFPSMDAKAVTFHENPGDLVIKVLQPLLIGGVRINRVPDGKMLSFSYKFPPGFVEFQRPQLTGPVPCYSLQVEKLFLKIRTDGNTRARPFGSITSTTAITSNYGVEGLQDAMVVPLRVLHRDILVCEISVRMASPASWLASDLAQVMLPEAAFGQVTRVELQFLSHGDRALMMPPPVKVTSALDLSEFTLNTSMYDGTDPLKLNIVPGKYTIAPDLQVSGEWKAPMSFTPVSLDVMGPLFRSEIVLDQPISLVDINVRDEFGRRVRSFEISAPGTGNRLFRSIPGLFPVDDTSWTLSIKARGYEDYYSNVISLEPGSITPHDVSLKRKETRR